MEIKNKIAIVTGASSGIGYAVSIELAKKGAKVALVARSKDKLEALSKKINSSFVIVTDMTHGDEIKKMVGKVHDHYKRVDILVNNAGQGYDVPVEKINTTTFQHVFNLDLVGPIIAMQQVIPIMRRQGGGAIINISSGTALMSLPNMSAYSSLKRALVGISLTAREELQNDHISVGVVYPYITATDFEKNTIQENNLTIESDEDRGGAPFPSDSAEYIAEKIVQGIESGEAEIYAHDWMKNNR